MKQKERVAIRVSRWWRWMTHKRRLGMVDPATNTEEWYTHITRSGLLAAAVAAGLLIFVIVLSLVAYTPILNLLPGYRADAARSRQSLMASIVRVDSLERIIDDMLVYDQNLSLVMDGKTPIVRLEGGQTDSVRHVKTTVPASAEDSLLRRQMQGGGLYGLGQVTVPTEKVTLAPPVEGVVMERFDVRKENYGVRVAVPIGAQAMAVDEGTVVSSTWSPAEGYTIAVQHRDLLAIYLHLSKSAVQVGQHVRRGEAIGSNTEALRGGESQIFEFQLWKGGKPLDPEAYVVF